MREPFIASHICSGWLPTAAAELIFERALKEKEKKEWIKFQLEYHIGKII